MTSLTITAFHDDYSEEEIQIPAKWQICFHCDGEGKSSAYLGAYTAEEMAEAGPEFKDDYMRGFYDRMCEHCNGTGKTKVADEARMTVEQLEHWKEHCEYQREMRRDLRSESILCGW